MSRNAALGGRGDHPGAAELAHLADDRQERASLLRQLVLDARRRFGVAPANEDTLALEHVEALGKRAGADAGTGLLELHETARTFGKIVDDQRGPLGGDDLGRCRDRAV